MKELDNTIEYIDRKLALSEVQFNNVLSSDYTYSVDCTSESGNTKINIFKKILRRDYGIKLSDACAKKEMNKLLEVYRNIIKNKRNICMKNMRS